MRQHAVVQQPIEDRGGDYTVAEHGSPFTHGAMARDQHRSALIAARYALKEQCAPTGVQGGPAIQYKDGNCNGIIFAEDFSSPNNTLLRRNIQGPTSSLIRLPDRGILFTGGRVNELTNVQPFTPGRTVPEPTTLLLLGAAVFALVLRRH